MDSPDEEDGGPAPKRPRFGRLTTDEEETIAVSAGRFEEPYECGVEEKKALPPGADEEAWCTMRNSIVARWLQDVTRPLSLEVALSPFVERHHGLARRVYAWLLTHGHINYGLLKQAPWPAATGAKPSVVVVGAGVAGLAAARQLLSFGHSVVIVEARSRPGGRVHTARLHAPASATGGDSAYPPLGATAELGGSVLTGCDANPLAVVCRQLGARLHAIRDPCPLFFGSDGSPVPRSLDAAVERRFNALLDACGSFRVDTGAAAGAVSLGRALALFASDAGFGARGADPRERHLLDWHISNLEYANAASVDDLSLGSWDQDDEWEMSGDHALLPGGNLRIVAALAKDVPIFYEQRVLKVEHGPTGVCVRTQGGPEKTDRCFKADVALITLPLGVLKAKVVEFEPPLPARKAAAIDALGYGTLNKCVMLFPNPPLWDTQADTFGRVSAPGESPVRGEHFLFYSYAGLTPTDDGGSILVGLTAGTAADAYEALPPATALARCLSSLRSIFGPTAVPQPLAWACTAWAGDEFSRGSYSHLPVGAVGEDYDALAEPTGPLHFGGEATARKYPATLHGAFLSGLREAGRISQRPFSPSPAAQQRQLAAQQAAAAARRGHSGVKSEGDALAAAVAAAADAVLGDGGGAHAHASPASPFFMHPPSARPNAASPPPPHLGGAGHHSTPPAPSALVPPPPPLPPPRLCSVGEEPCLAAAFADALRHPDVWEFGAFTVRFPPAPSSSPPSTPPVAPPTPALVRLQLAKSADAGKRPLPLYLLLEPRAAEQLRDVKGGDSQRLAVLVTLPGGAVHGRGALGARAAAFLESVRSAEQVATAATATTPAQNAQPAEDGAVKMEGV